MTTVGPRYPETLGIELRRGRELDHRDSANGASAVLVNEALVRRLFADGEVLGRRMWLPGQGDEPRSGFEIVGVVADTRHSTSWRSRNRWFSSRRRSTAVLRR